MLLCGVFLSLPIPQDELHLDPEEPFQLPPLPLRRPRQDEPEEAEDVQEPVPEAPLQEAARMMMEVFSNHALVSLEQSAKQAEVSRGVLRRRLHAVAEMARCFQRSFLDRVLAYCEQMVGATLQPVAWVEHCLYDETPLRMRVVMDETAGMLPEKVSGKIFVVQQDWCVLAKATAGPALPQLRPEEPEQAEHAVVPEPPTNYFFFGSKSPEMRAVDRCTGEGIRNVLLATRQPVDFQRVGFKHSIRVSEAGNLAANNKAEFLFQAEQPPSLHFLHALCVPHQLHSAAEKTWEIQDGLLSGLIHMCKLLSDGGLRTRLRQAISLAIPARVQRVCVDVVLPLAADAANYKNDLLSMVLPGRAKARKQSMLRLMAELLNDDWRIKKKLVHRCPPGCCMDAHHTSSKLDAVLPKIMLSLCPSMFMRNNWKEWHSQMSYFLLAGVHGLLQDVLLAVFSETPIVEEAFLDEQGQEQLAAAAAEAMLHPPHQAADENPYERERRERNKSLRTVVDFSQQATVARKPLAASSSTVSSNQLHAHSLEQRVGRV